MREKGEGDADGPLCPTCRASAQCAQLQPRAAALGSSSFLVNYDDLAAFVGTRKVLALKAWLARNRIQWMADHKRRPITTVSAINRGLTNRRIGADVTQGVRMQIDPMRKGPKKKGG